MVAKGGYTDLQKSGLDFTALLKHEDEEEEQAMSEESARSQTVSSTSTPTVNNEADQMPVGPWCFRCRNTFSLMLTLFSLMLTLFVSNDYTDALMLTLSVTEMLTRFVLTNTV